MRKIFDVELSARNGLFTELSLPATPYEVEFMWPHLNLHTYGQALVERFGGMLTEYGSVERTDGEPIQQVEPEPTTGKMEMIL